MTDCHVCVHNARLRSLPPLECAWENGNGMKSAIGLCLHMPRTDRKKARKTYKKESETNRGKVWIKKIKIGRRRTFLRSLVSMFQGSYVVVSQQQASSAAYNTRGVLCSTTGWQTIPEWTLQTVRFQKQNRKISLKDIRQYIHPDLLVCMSSKTVLCSEEVLKCSLGEIFLFPLLHMVTI